MPAAPQIDEVLATKPVTFNIKTSGGSWKCQIHPNRAAFERATKSVSTPVSTSMSAPAPTPGIARTDSGLSTMSTASTSSSSSSSSSSSH
ncbi:hypothetical protein F5B18DRAFT_277053 [Nemania serpens]|nr:hypothetical protein F5B18DRAFT_277053 [Nemania serpens]